MEVENIVDDGKLITKKLIDLVEVMANFASITSFLITSYDELNEKKLIRILKDSRNFLQNINDNAFDIIKLLESEDKDINYSDYVNNSYK